MKVVILAGGLGTRISEETGVKPKPMIEIGDLPLLMHIMRNFSGQGFNEFVICLGYKGYVIKEYFANLKYHLNDMHVDFSVENPYMVDKTPIDWKVDLVDTGLNTLTGGRLKRIKKYTNREPFIMTYGDGLADLNIQELLKFHREKGRLATVTAVKPPARFGALEIDDSGIVNSFAEKFESSSNWINGGFFVLEQGIFDFIQGDSTVWEKDPLVQLTNKNELSAFKHYGFWKPCDTLREKHELQQIWENGAPWKNW